MRVGVLGINYKSAPLSLREKVAQVCRQSMGGQIVVLPTCHRVEIYFSHDDLAAVQSHLFAELKKTIAHSSEHAFYSYFGKECFFHLACVTTGLDSAMLAESDIQRQVKVAYETVRKETSLPSPLHYIFQKALHLGKHARSTFSLFQTPLHLEGMIYQLVQRLVGHESPVLFIGNSDINRKIIHYLRRKSSHPITLCTRSLEAAHPFALDYGLSLKDRTHLLDWAAYDVVIAATHDPAYLIHALPPNGKARLLFDLSVPRSIDPALRRHPGVTLLNMEEIAAFFDHFHHAYKDEVQAIKFSLETSIESYVNRYEAKISLKLKN